MLLNINIKRSAVKDLKNIDKTIALKIVEILENFGEKEIKESLKLQGIKDKKDLYRYRFKDYRIIYDKIDFKDSVNIDILRILHRQNAYDKI